MTDGGTDEDEDREFELSIIQDKLEDELEELDPVENWGKDAVLWSTDWTAETILSQMKKRNIDLDPSFQRRSAWKETKQSLFIESLILGLPIPQLILANDKISKNSFLVIDGKQRLLAIRCFADQDQDGRFKPLKLKGLSRRKDLNGKTYADLCADARYSYDLNAFENSSIRTVVIKHWEHDSYLYQVFLRINTGSVQLSPQELRQALHPGPFSSFIGKASGESEELRRALNLKAPDFRMRDAEILLRHLAYKNFIHSYAGNLKAFLDNATKKIQANWNLESGRIVAQAREMDEAIKFTREIFGEDAYLRKWDRKQFEPRKNKAIFDIMLHYFSVPEVREALAGKGSEIVEGFKALCDNDREFYASVEITTKSIDNNRKRFNTWGQLLENISGLDLSQMKYGD